MGLSMLVSLVSLEYGSMSGEKAPLALFLILRFIHFWLHLHIPLHEHVHCWLLQTINRIVVLGWTLCDSHLFRLYFGIFQPSEKSAFDHNLPQHPLQSGDHRWLLALVPLPQVPQDGEWSLKRGLINIKIELKFTFFSFKSSSEPQSPQWSPIFVLTARRSRGLGHWSLHRRCSSCSSFLQVFFSFFVPRALYLRYVLFILYFYTFFSSWKPL